MFNVVKIPSVTVYILRSFEHFIIIIILKRAGIL